MKKYKKIFILILCCLPFSGLFSQHTDTTSIHKYEQILSELFDRISNHNNDLQKERINSEIVDTFEKVLAIEGSFSYPFDSLSYVGKITSNDNKLRIYTWNLPYMNGTHKYFGFIQYYPPEEKNFLLYKLIDSSENYESPENLILADTTWFGALYYEIAEKKHEGNTYYTLLGFDFNDFLTSKKIIEILYFKDDKLAVFGKPVFNYRNKIISRIIFEYSAKVSMVLKYNKDLKMIIFDHLSPSKPSYEGHFMYYGPDFSYDGLEFKDGIWNEVPDVDVRNPAY
jgi:hypothetical protein